MQRLSGAEPGAHPPQSRWWRALIDPWDNHSGLTSKRQDVEPFFFQSGPSNAHHHPPGRDLAEIEIAGAGRVNDDVRLRCEGSTNRAAHGAGRSRYF
jgi:hypothetical protein